MSHPKQDPAALVANTCFAVARALAPRLNDSDRARLVDTVAVGFSGMNSGLHLRWTSLALDAEGAAADTTEPVTKALSECLGSLCDTMSSITWRYWARRSAGMKLSVSENVHEMLSAWGRSGGAPIAGVCHIHKLDPSDWDVWVTLVGDGRLLREAASMCHALH